MSTVFPPLPDLPAALGMKWGEHPGKIGAGIAESDFGTAPVVTAALHEAVERGFLGYLPPAVAERARACLADYLARTADWAVPVAQIQLTPDVLTALMVTLQHFTPAGSPVIVPMPAYAHFFRVLRAAGRPVIPVSHRLDDGRWVPDVDEIRDAFAAGAGLLLLCNPHNPLGTVLRAEEMRQIADVVEEAGGRVFADEIHAPVVYAGARHIPYASLDERTAAHTVTATSTSKGWNLPGLKCAQIILTNPRDLSLWHEHDPVPGHTGSGLGALATAAAYSPAGTDWLAATLVRLDAQRALVTAHLSETLPEARYAQPEASYLAWIGLDAYGLGPDPAAHLAAAADLIVTDGGGCGTGGAGHIRFNFAMREDILPHALERLSRTVLAGRGVDTALRVQG